MLLDSVYKRLKEVGIKEFVFEEDVIEQLSMKSEIIHSIKDVRSATFYACGLAQKNDASVALFIRKEYLPSALTGLTEAWFQCRNIIVVAFGEHIINDDLSYLRNCTNSRFKIQSEEDIQYYITENIYRKTPELFLVECNVPVPEKYLCNSKINLNNTIPSVDKVFVYSKLANLFDEDKRIVYVDERDKYGIISKFIGYSIGSDKKIVLVIDDSLIYYDVNIFNNRYLNESFKILIIGKLKNLTIIKWLESNHINFFKESNPSQALSILLEIKKATVAIVNYWEEDN